jgi:hypothetical protein
VPAAIATEEAVLVRARPARHEGAEHGDADHGEGEEQPRVEGDAHLIARSDRDHDQHDEVRDQRHRRGEREDPAVGGGRDDLLLLRELHPVRDELRPAVETAGVHRAEPALHVRHHLVLGLPDEQGQDQERDDDQQQLDRDDRQVRHRRRPRD